MPALPWTDGFRGDVGGGGQEGAGDEGGGAVALAPPRRPVAGAAGGRRDGVDGDGLLGTQGQHQPPRQRARRAGGPHLAAVALIDRRICV